MNGRNATNASLPTNVWNQTSEEKRGLARVPRPPWMWNTPERLARQRKMAREFHEKFGVCPHCGRFGKIYKILDVVACKECMDVFGFILSVVESVEKTVLKASK